jgi:hypothetical protein
VVEEGENGRLLPEDTSPEGFAKAIEEFVTRPEVAEKWRDAAARTATSFSREACAKRLFRLYESVVQDFAQKEMASVDFILWDKLLRSLKVEWDLVCEKAAALGPFKKDQPEDGPDR